jgi:hypothetical protein
MIKDIKSPIFILPSFMINEDDLANVKNLLDNEIPYFDSYEEYSDKEFHQDVCSSIPENPKPNYLDSLTKFLWQSSIFCGPIMPIMVKNQLMVATAMSHGFNTKEELYAYIKENKSLIYCIYTQPVIDKTNLFLTFEEVKDQPTKIEYILRDFDKVELTWLQFKLQKLASMKLVPRWVKIKFFKWCCTIK